MIRHSDERNLLPEPYEEFVVAGREFRRFRSTEFYYQSTYDYVTGLLACNGRSIDDVVRFLHPWRRVLSEFSRDQFLRFSNDCKWNVEEDPWVLLGRGFLVFHQTYFSYGCGPAFVPLDADPWTGDGELYRGRNRVLEQLEEHGWMQGIENGLEYAVVSPRWDEAFRLTRKQLLRPSEELYTIMRDSRLALVEDDAVIGIALANGYIRGAAAYPMMSPRSRRTPGGSPPATPRSAMDGPSPAAGSPTTASSPPPFPRRRRGYRTIWERRRACCTGSAWTWTSSSWWQTTTMITSPTDSRGTSSPWSSRRSW